MKTGLIAVWLIAGILLVVGPCPAGTISSGLQQQLVGRKPDEVLTVLVVLPDQVDVRALAGALRTEKVALSRRHTRVVVALQEQAAASQQNLLAALSANKANGGIDSYAPHWLVNAVVVTGTVTAVRSLAARADVLRVEADLVPELIEPVATWQPTAKEALGIGLVPGLAAIGAPRVWRELGIDGTGTLVGVIDSGVDVDHPALSARWRGHFADPASAWFDAAQAGGSSQPSDNLGHGTHVMGTITGLAPGDTIGVAPGAQWLAANGIMASSAAFDNAILASLEFMTDPDGDPATTDDVPDVVQNSWGVNESITGYLDCDSRWWAMIDNCEAAGVVLVWAAGNEGPDAGTMRSPADRASNPYNCFAVGATSTRAPFLVSDYSSRGPSGCGGPYAIKPELMAPGDSIYSALPGGGYIYRTGTSMAGPHVAGVVALMRQANPDVDVVTIKDVLMATAQDLGPPGEDNDYGHGLVDAYAAVLGVMGGIGTVDGEVTNSVTGVPVAAALLQRTDGFNLTRSDGQGQYSLTMAAGTTSFTVSAFGCFDGSLTVTIPDGGTVNGDVGLAPQPSATLSGVVRGPDLLPVMGATVRIQDTPLPSVETDSTGFYRVELPLDGSRSYILCVSTPGLGTEVVSVLLTGDMTQDIDLPELNWEDFESGGFQSYPWEFGGNAPWLIDNSQAYEGQLCAGSGEIGDSEASNLRLDYYVAFAGELRFRYKVSSEFSFDFLYFLIDGVEQSAWSGEIDWTLFTAQIPVGNHTFVWGYVKDEVIGAGFDRAWLDFVEFPQTGVEPRPLLEFAPAVLTASLAEGMNTIRTAVLTNSGTADLDFVVAATSPDSLTWLQISPLSGSIVPGGSTEIQVKMDATDVAAGVQVATLNIASNDSTNQNAAISLELTVGALSAATGVPRVLSLCGAVPNPFNPQTLIHYELPRRGRISLVVYDLRGRVVRQLVAGTQAAGKYAVVWNGQDDFGQGVASGTYFARLVWAGKQRVRPLSLVR